MQKRVSFLFIIIASISISANTIAVAQPNYAETASSGLADVDQSNSDLSTKALISADSLYAAKQYTQAFELYQSLYKSGHYSPAMLLKMAHIQEGLNHLGESLFYLNIYFLASDDHQALKKMEELAKKNNLEGYETSETTKIFMWLQEEYTTLALAIASMALFLLALMYYQHTKSQVKPSLTGILLVTVLAILFVHINFSKKESRGIVADSQTYLMSGPSAGASVVAIIGEGHQLEIEGKKDVWLHVRWKEKDAWIRETRLRAITL